MQPISTLSSYLRKSRQHDLLTLLLIATFLKGVVTAAIVPIWEFPDEQAHFAQVSHYVERGTKFGKNDLSLEIYESQRLLGTLRNIRGENKYTYHPEYKPTYSNSTTGPYENYIRSLGVNSRTKFVKKEAARYPPFFYQLSSTGYRLSYNSDLFTRVYTTRLISILLAVISIYFAHRLGLTIFSGNKFLATSLAATISFHPMFSFVSSGINNDNGVNLIGLILLWVSLETLDKGLNNKRALALGVASGLGVLTKPLVFPVSLAVGLVLIFDWFKSKRNWKTQFQVLAILIISSIISGGWLFFTKLFSTGTVPYIPDSKSKITLETIGILDYLLPQLSRYYRETLVWYWGVFKWLGLILPLNLIRIFKILMGTAGIGVMMTFLSKKPIVKKTHLATMLIFTVVYFSSITIWDYLLVKNAGFSHGLQGRYFFPTIGAHMGLLFTGLMFFAKVKLQNLASKSIVIFMISANTISLATLAKSYYSHSTISSLIIQMSQYKPQLFKFPFVLFWFSLYAFILAFFLLKYLNYKTKQ